MTDFTWPSVIVPSSAALTWKDNTAVFISPLSGTIRTENQSGGRWSLSLTIHNLKNATVVSNPIHELEAFLFKLNGVEHRAVIQDFAYVRSGPGGGTPLVNGASQTGLSLITDGWPNSTTVLYAGDRVGVANQMIPITADGTSNGSGQLTLSLAHPIRVAPSNNAAIEISNPTARYILSNNASVAAQPGIFKTLLVEFEEAIP